MRPLYGVVEDAAAAGQPAYLRLRRARASGVAAPGVAVGYAAATAFSRRAPEQARPRHRARMARRSRGRTAGLGADARLFAGRGARRSRGIERSQRVPHSARAPARRALRAPARPARRALAPRHSPRGATFGPLALLVVARPVGQRPYPDGAVAEGARPGRVRLCRELVRSG